MKHLAFQPLLTFLVLLGMISFQRISLAQKVRWVDSEGKPLNSGLVEKASLARTTGVKKLIFIRVDFPDKQGETISTEKVREIMDQVNAFYEANSQGKTSIVTDITPVFRLPQSVEWYAATGKNNGGRSKAVVTDARLAARTAGYDINSYQLEIVNCRTLVVGDSQSGGAIAAKGLFLVGLYGLGITAHELGHNYGLGHARLWLTTDGSVIGEGELRQYGNPFDVMGNTSGKDAMLHHFTAYSKYFLNWLPDDAVKTVTTNGTYRIFAHDLPNTSGLRALVIKKDDTRDYWIEFRQLQTNNFSLMNGALIYWTYNKIKGVTSSFRATTLLDMTPGSPEGAADAPLFIGRTFTDKEAGIHITPIGKGGTNPESLDIVVNFGQFPDNKAPTVKLIPSALTAKLGESITFKAEASDPDGDKIAYSWDTSDGEVAGNVTEATRSWTLPGKYKVHCIVTDMKGGTGEDTVEINVR
jgi:hypothetical protein